MDTPVWKKAFDEAERAVSPALTNLMATPEVIEALTVAIAVRKRFLEDVGKVASRVLHTWNMPAGSDVRKVSVQIANLERQLRSVNRQLDELKQERTDDGKE